MLAGLANLANYTSIFKDFTLALGVKKIVRETRKL